MSTPATTVVPITPNAKGIGKTYMGTYVVLAEYTRGPAAEDGSATRSTSTKVLPEARANKIINEAHAAHAALTPDKQAENQDLLPEIIKGQSCLFSEAAAIDELLPLCTVAGKEDQAESIALGHFNRGAVLAQQQEIRGLLEDPTFTPQDGVLDLHYAIAQKSESRAKSPEEKAAKILSTLPGFGDLGSADEIAALLKQFAAARAQQGEGAATA